MYKDHPRRCVSASQHAAAGGPPRATEVAAAEQARLVRSGPPRELRGIAPGGREGRSAVTSPPSPLTAAPPKEPKGGATVRTSMQKVCSALLHAHTDPRLTTATRHWFQHQSDSTPCQRWSMLTTTW